MVIGGRESVVHSGRAALGFLFLCCATSNVAWAQLIPNDPDFASQWGLHNTGQLIAGEAGTVGADTDAPEAWARFAGAANVVVAIIGRGIDPHPEYVDRLLEGHATVGDLFNTLDTCPHDTHLAGIIAAESDNNVGVAGIIDSTLILPVRVLDGCGGTELSTAEGIVWAVDNGANVILAAVQFFVGSQPLADAIAYALAHDVVVVAPAGSAGNNEVAYPARFDGCLAVTATTNQDTLSNASNYGLQVDLSAPGRNIWSTWIGEGYAFQLDNRDTASAAAYVTSVAALVRSYAPHLSAAEVMQVLRDSADDLGSTEWDTSFGYGRINADRALQMATPPALRFEYIERPPTSIPPGVGSSFEIRIIGVAEAVVAETVELAYRAEGAEFTTAPALHLIGDHYRVDLPATPCDTVLEYYLSAMGSSASVVTDPIDAPTTVHTATAVIKSTLFEDDFETDQGWESVVHGESTRGTWKRVAPSASMGQPGFDRSPDSGTICYITGQFESVPDQIDDVDGGPVTLTSPVVAIDGVDVEVEYALWFYWSGAGAEDFLTVEFSRDAGASWELVEIVSSLEAWETHSFRLSEYPAVVGDQLRVRFSTADSPNDSLTEAGVDEFRVTAIECATLQGDANGDGVIDHFDYAELPACLAGPGVGVAAACQVFDFDGNGRVDLSDFGGLQVAFGSP